MSEMNELGSYLLKTEARALLDDLSRAAQRLSEAIPAKRAASAVLDAAKKELAACEAGLIMASELDAQNKVGPLANIARTSKAYTYAIDHLLLNGSRIQYPRQHDTVRHAQTEYDAACNEFEQAETMFHAVKYKSTLLSALLGAWKD